jgi:hypothetical protein
MRDLMDTFTAARTIEPQPHLLPRLVSEDGPADDAPGHFPGPAIVHKPLEIVAVDGLIKEDGRRDQRAHNPREL